MDCAYILMCLLVRVILCDLQCLPAEEGKSQILSHQEMYDQISVTWEIYSKAIDDWGTICEAYKTEGYHCKVLQPGLFAVSQPPNELTILNVSRKDIDLETSYRFLYGSSNSTCQLKVYATPTTLTCDAPRLSTTITGGQGRDVIVTCSTDKVYPKAQCAFKLQSQTVELQRVNYTYQHATYDDVAYYQSSCTLTYHVTSPASYAFDVDMYLNIDGSRYGTRKNQTTQLHLTLPTAVKSPTCPEGTSNANDVRDGYIRNGATATCLCTRDNPGLPEGKVLWYKGNGNTPVSSQNSGETLSRLTIPQGTANYVCKGTSDLGTQQDGVTYSPKFAYGPTSVKIPASIGHIDLCPASHKSGTMNCSVSKSDVAPYPLFRVIFDGHSVAGKENGSLQASEYIFTKTFEPKSGGEYEVQCQAENAVFSDMKASQELRVEVREPPSSAPVFKIRQVKYTDKSNVTVDGDINSTLSIACEAEGGYPDVNNVTLKCGSDVSSKGGKTVSMDVTVSKDTPGLDCSCTALHVTGCYHNNIAVVMLTFTFEKHESSSSEGGNTAAIAGGVIGGILLLVGVIVAVVIVQRKGLLGKFRNKDPKLTNRHGSPVADDEITHTNDLYGPVAPKASGASPYEDMKSSDNGTDQYSNNAFSRTKDESDVYENTKSQEKGKGLAPGRYVNKEGLIYTEVEISGPSKSSASQSASLRPRIVEDGVQYTAVEFKK